jgi:LacI family transcriptional regulator
MKNPKRATLYDVAREAGVSYQTVSRVINDSPHVSSKTRNRVLRTIRELDYVPNRAAQILQTHRSHTIEFITPNIWGTEASGTAAMAFRAQQLGFQLTLVMVTAEEFRSAIAGASNRLVDGLIVTPYTLSSQISDEELFELARGIPIVRLKGDIGTSIPAVVYDQRAGARSAVQHLIALGHRHIAEIYGNMDIFDARARHEAWMTTLQAANIEPGPSIAGDFGCDSGYAAMVQLLNSGTPITAVFAGNDEMALGAMYAIRERGLRVPEDISLVGFDDLPTARYFATPLTTIRQNWELMGRLAIEHMVSCIEQPDTPVYQRVLTPELIVRQSTRSL